MVGHFLRRSEGGDYAEPWGSETCGKGSVVVDDKEAAYADRVVVDLAGGSRCDAGS